LGEPAGVKERGSESWKDGAGEEIDVVYWWEEELGGGQTEPVRSQVREESSEGGSVGGRDTYFEGGRWQGVFEKCYKIGAERVESGEKEKLGHMEFRTTCHCDGRNCQDLEVCENQSLRFYIILETKGEGAEKASQWMCLM
jgi:hypothetical protein